MKLQLPNISATASSVATKTQPIPFRTDSAVAAGDIFYVLIATTFLLLLAAVGLYWAKKKNLIPTWLKSHPLEQKEPALKKIESTRISPSTVLHRISDGKNIYLIAESNRNISMLLTEKQIQEAQNETR
jgi:hypothetical protein